jgi:hypothetical protein
MSDLILDSGKLHKLDKLLEQLKAEGHRCLIYFQMTRMIDLMEEYISYKQYKYMRLDGSSKISDRRDMVTDWQTRPEIFIFLLSTRAGGLGINLTAADTVIFYDSDWNPTVDQQAMDRAHRLGQTKQVTVYRLITKGTIEERILMRAKQKDEVSGNPCCCHLVFTPSAAVTNQHQLLNRYKKWLFLVASSSKLTLSRVKLFLCCLMMKVCSLYNCYVLDRISTS